MSDCNITTDDRHRPSGMLADNSSGGGTTLTFDNSGMQTFAAAIESRRCETMALVVEGTGTLILRAANAQS